MKRFSLGIDTSCYTTSIAVVDNDGTVLVDERIPLSVKKGAKGLRQSDAFYQHVLNLPGLFEKTLGFRDFISTVCTSTRPRNHPDSYMPVFNSGTAFANVISGALDTRLHACSHQEGHIMSILPESGIKQTESFAVVHISGGTAEILEANFTDNHIDTKLIGGSLDLTAGQLIDRLGLELGCAFPAGNALDQIAFSSSLAGSYPISVRDGYFNLSGIENLFRQDLKRNVDPAEITTKVFRCVSDSLLEALKQLGLMNKPILMTGGVSASRFLRKEMRLKSGNIRFGPAGLCTDNAVGVARMGILLMGADSN